MKILHTADWHIGKRLDRFPRIEEQRAVLEEIVDLTHREDPDLVLVAGDLWDTFNPGSDAQELLYRTLRDLADDGRRAVVAIAGNHDSPDRVTAPEVLARTHGIVLSGYPDESIPAFTAGAVTATQPEPGLVELSIDRPATTGVPVRIISVPYAIEARLRRALGDAGDADSVDAGLQSLLASRWRTLAERHCRTPGVHLMVAHLLFSAEGVPAEEEPDGERPIGHIGGAPAVSTAVIPPEIQYVACGHLHRPHAVPGPTAVRYAGSPLSYSFAETGQTKSVTIVELEPRAAEGSLFAEPAVTEHALSAGRPLVRHRAASVADALTWLEEHPAALVELSIELDEYLSGADRRRLHEAHDGIVTIVPIVAGVGAAGGDRPRIDPTADMRSLFVRYFEERTGAPPDAAVLDLFSEVIAE